MTPTETLVTLAKELEAELNKGRDLPKRFPTETQWFPSPIFYIGNDIPDERVRAVLKALITSSEAYHDADTFLSIRLIDSPDLDLNPYQDLCYFTITFIRSRKA